MELLKIMVVNTMLFMNRCPYCKVKMLKGVGGEKESIRNDFTVCPYKHFAKEIDDKEKIITIYDGGGLPLPIKQVNQKEKTLY